MGLIHLACIQMDLCNSWFCTYFCTKTQKEMISTLDAMLRIGAMCSSGVCPLTSKVSFMLCHLTYQIKLTTVCPERFKNETYASNHSHVTLISIVERSAQRHMKLYTPDICDSENSFIPMCNTRSNFIWKIVMHALTLCVVTSEFFIFLLISATLVWGFICSRTVVNYCILLILIQFH